MSIAPYQHMCVIETGDLRGNTCIKDVGPYAARHGDTCDNCGEVLATPEDIALHLYEQLLGD